MGTDNPHRPVYQIHLSTLLVQMVLMAFFLFVQSNPTRSATFDWESHAVGEVELRGWPQIHTIEYQGPKARQKPVAGTTLWNVGSAVAVMFLVYLLQESYLRRAEPLLTRGRVAEILLLVGVLTFCVWLAQEQYRRHRVTCLWIHDEEGCEAIVREEELPFPRPDNRMSLEECPDRVFGEVVDHFLDKVERRGFVYRVNAGPTVEDYLVHLPCSERPWPPWSRPPEIEVRIGSSLDLWLTPRQCEAIGLR